MNCPYCRREMTPGTIEVHGAKSGRFDATLFAPSDGGDRENILEQTSREALRCDDCATLIIRGRFATEGEPDAGGPYR